MTTGGTMAAHARRTCFAAALLLALAACGARDDDRAADAPPFDAGVDQPEEDVPPATAPPGARFPDPGLPTPAPGAIGYAGFGPATFGDPAEAVRMAWGRELAGAESEPGGCYYLYPLPRPAQGYRLGFMVEGGRFVRVDVDADDLEAPGGGRVGMQADEILQRYGDGAVQQQPHKYLAGGRVLRIADPGGGPGVLLFEVGEDGVVREWRVGVPPQVDYVEGCG